MRIPIISSILERRSRGYSLADLERQMDAEINGVPSFSGVNVSENTALNSVPVFACVRVISETIASLPWITYRRLTPRGKERDISHPLYTLLHDSPNPEMTSFQFREALQGHLLTWGNAYAEIEYDMGSGRIAALWPLRPDRMKVKRISKGILEYHYSLGSGQTVILKSYQVLHIPGMGFDGVMGYSPITMARQAIGLTMATEEFGARFFGNGALPGIYLKHPNTLSDQARENIAKSWNKQHQGLSKSHRLGILEEGMDVVKVGIPPEDAQFLETRKYQKTEIASLFHVPPHMIGDLERATFSNIEQQSLEFVIYTIRPWLVRWEQAGQVKFQLQGTSNFTEFLVDGLLRGDIKSRYEAYAISRNWGWTSANDIRELENQNPIEEGGDIYLVPMNMVPADQVASLPALNPGNSNSFVNISQEIRAASNGPVMRYKVALSYRRIFQEAAGKLVQREASNIRAAARKYLGSNDLAGWNDWLSLFYRDFGEYIERQITPPIHSLAETITPMALAEVNSPDIQVDTTKFLNDYISTFVTRYSQSGEGQLKAVARDNIGDGELGSLSAVEVRLDEWESRRPEKVARNETTRVANAVAYLAFGGAGITRLRWWNTGDSNCPYCREMNGRTVEINQPFIPKGESLNVEGQPEMKTYQVTKHPPLHGGCDCTVGPG